MNTPNVILYAAPSEQCETPTSKCYEKIANMHNPFIYEPKEDLELRFMVRGLDNSEFTITIIDEGTDSIPLNDGQPFSYLMDDKEE